MDGCVITRAPDDIHDIVLDPRLDPHISYFGATEGNRRRVCERLDINLIQTAGVESCVPTGDDLLFIFSRRIRQNDLQQETIELRFGQWVGAFVLNWILRSQHREQWRERMAFAVN